MLSDATEILDTDFEDESDYERAGSFESVSRSNPVVEALLLTLTSMTAGDGVKRPSHPTMKLELLVLGQAPPGTSSISRFNQ